MVALEQAREIVGAFLAPHRGTGFDGGVGDVRDGRGARVYAYLTSGEALKDCWVAYVEGGEPGMIRSSHVLLISKKTGKIAYNGSANDEG